MTTPTQGDLRAWARSRGMPVGDRGRLATAVRAAYAAEHGNVAGPAGATEDLKPSVPVAAERPAGPGDLAVDMTRFLASVESEVLAVSSLSERIDALVADLNACRDEQSRRLTALDELQAAATDPTLSAFLQQAIRPQGVQVPEIVPRRLQQR